jgi:arylsulfatase
VRGRPREALEAAPLTSESQRVAPFRDAVRDANVVICVIDAARADHIGCYGYPRETTPNIDRMASASMVFQQHFVQFTFTKASTMSLLTSQHPDTHLALDERQVLEGTFTMAKGLEAVGMHTVLFSSNPNASPGMGVGLDFQESYDQGDVEPLVESWEQFTSPEALLTLIESWLAKNQRRRFFAYVHFDPPHQPYIQPDWMTELFEGQRRPGFRRGDFEFPVEERKEKATSAHPPWSEWINLYDANLRYADWAVGELERLLRKAGVLDRTLLIVTADHGEAFGEHGYIWHGSGVYEELVRVPLLIRFPGGDLDGTVAALTQTIDLLPTVFDLLEAPYPREGVQGTSLLPLVAGLDDRAHDYVFARCRGEPPSYLVRSPKWAFMLWGNGEWRALYDLETDPGQTENIIDQHPDVAGEMLAAFEEFAVQQRRPPVEFLDPDAAPAPLPAAGKTEITPEVERQLKALGYVD